MTGVQTPTDAKRGQVPSAPVSRMDRVEGVAIAAGTVTLFVLGGFDWWWLLALFVAFDLTFLGYAVSIRTGAIAYNIAHNYAAPAVLLAVYGILLALGTPSAPLAIIAASWFFHVGVDRALGFGPRPLR